MKNIFLIFACLVLLLLSCKKKSVNLKNNISFDIQNNVSYGNDSEQEMDIYIPQNAKQNHDIFIIIHGGGWRGGKKSDLSFFTLSLMEKFPNSVFANIEYRLATTKRFAIPTQTDDIKSALDFLQKKLNYNPKFILLGNSAGGHLSMLYGYKFNTEKNIKAVVNIVGPADLSDTGFKNYIDYSFVENHLIDPKSINVNLSKEKFISPVYWINSTSVPTLSFYGNNDQIIPISQKKILDSTLSVNNVFHQSFEYKGDHMGWIKEQNSSFIINKTYEFIRNLDNKKTH